MKQRQELMDVIGYQFKNEAILKNALTHSSYANENKDSPVSNERLEFLGDSVLSIVVSDRLYRYYPHLPEGELTKIRASLVCEKALSEFAREISLGEYILFGKGELATGGKERASILADAFEALIASIYIDGGFGEAQKFVLHFTEDLIENYSKAAFHDYKTVLQEIIQQNREEKLSYVLAEESGPDHNKRFVVEVHLNSNVIGVGVGGSKKEAEQAAAKEALSLMGE